MERYSPNIQQNPSGDNMQENPEHHENSFHDNGNNNYPLSVPFNQYDDMRASYFDGFSHGPYSNPNMNTNHGNSMLESNQSTNTSLFNNSNNLRQQNYFPINENIVNRGIDNNTHENIPYDDNINDPIRQESVPVFVMDDIDSSMYNDSLYVLHNQSYESSMYAQQNTSNITYSSDSIDEGNNNSSSLENNFVDHGDLNDIEINDPAIFEDINIEDHNFIDSSNNQHFYDNNVNVTNESQNHNLNSSVFPEQNTVQPTMITNDNNKSSVSIEAKKTIPYMTGNLSYDEITITTTNNIKQNGMNNHDSTNILQLSSSRSMNNINQNLPSIKNISSSQNDISNASNNSRMHGIVYISSGTQSVYHSESNVGSSDQKCIAQNSLNQQAYGKNVHLRRALTQNTSIESPKQPFSQSNIIRQNMFDRNKIQNQNFPQNLNNSVQHSSTYHNSNVNHYYPQNQQGHENLKIINDLHINKISKTDNNFASHSSILQPPSYNNYRNNSVHSHSVNSNALLDVQMQQNLSHGMQKFSEREKQHHENVHQYPNTPQQNNLTKDYIRRNSIPINLQSNHHKQSQRNIRSQNNEYFDHGYENSYQTHFPGSTINSSTNQSGKNFPQQQSQYQTINKISGNHQSPTNQTHFVPDKLQNVRQNVYDQNANQVNRNPAEYITTQDIYGVSNLQQQIETNHQHQIHHPSGNTPQEHLQPNINKQHSFYQYPQGTVMSNFINSQGHFGNNKNNNSQYSQHNFIDQSDQSQHYYQQNMRRPVYNDGRELHHQSNALNNQNFQQHPVQLNKQMSGVVESSNNYINRQICPENQIPYTSNVNTPQNTIVKNTSNPPMNHPYLFNNRNHNIQHPPPSVHQNQFIQNPSSLNNYSVPYRDEGQYNNGYYNNNMQNNNMLLNSEGKVQDLHNGPTDVRRPIEGIPIIPQEETNVRKKRSYVRRIMPSKEQQIGDILITNSTVKTPNKNLPNDVLENEIKVPKRRGRKSKAIKELEARIAEEARLAEENRIILEAQTVTDNNLNNYNNEIHLSGTSEGNDQLICSEILNVGNNVTNNSQTPQVVQNIILLDEKNNQNSIRDNSFLEDEFMDNQKRISNPKNNVDKNRTFCVIVDSEEHVVPINQSSMKSTINTCRDLFTDEDIEVAKALEMTFKELKNCNLEENYTEKSDENKISDSSKNSNAVMNEITFVDKNYLDTSSYNLFKSNILGGLSTQHSKINSDSTNYELNMNNASDGRISFNIHENSLILKDSGNEKNMKSLSPLNISDIIERNNFSYQNDFISHDIDSIHRNLQYKNHDNKKIDIPLKAQENKNNLLSNLDEEINFKKKNYDNTFCSQLSRLLHDTDNLKDEYLEYIFARDKVIFVPKIDRKLHIFPQNLGELVNMTVKLEVTPSGVLHGIYVNFPYDLNKIKIKRKLSPYCLLSMLIREILETLKVSNVAIVIFNYQSFTSTYDGDNNLESSVYTDLPFYDFNTIYGNKKTLQSNDGYGIILNVEENGSEFYLTFSKYPLYKCNKRKRNLKECLEECFIENNNLLRPHYFDSKAFGTIQKGVFQFFERKYHYFLNLCNTTPDAIYEKLIERYVSEECKYNIPTKLNRNEFVKERFHLFLTQNLENMNKKNIGKLVDFNLCGLIDFIYKVPNTLKIRKLGNFRQYCGNICTLCTFYSSSYTYIDRVRVDNLNRNMSIENLLKELGRHNLGIHDRINIFRNITGISSKDLIIMLWKHNKSSLPLDNEIFSDMCLTMSTKSRTIDNKNNMNNELEDGKVKDKNSTITIDFDKNCLNMVEDTKINTIQDEATINHEIEITNNNNYNTDVKITEKSFVKQENALNMKNTIFNLTNKSNKFEASYLEDITCIYDATKMSIVECNFKFKNNLTKSRIKSTKTCKINDTKVQVAIAQLDLGLNKTFDFSNNLVTIPELSQSHKITTTIKDYNYNIAKIPEKLEINVISKDISQEEKILNVNNKQFIFSKETEKMLVSHVEDIKRQEDKTNLKIIQAKFDIKNNLNKANIESIEKTKINDIKEQLSIVESSKKLNKKFESFEYSVVLPELSNATEIMSITCDREFIFTKCGERFETNIVIKDKSYEKYVLNTNNLQTHLLRTQEKENLFHIGELRYQKDNVNLNIIQANMEIESNFEETSVASIQIVKSNEAYDSLSITTSNCNLHRKNYLSECSDTIIEQSQISTTKLAISDIDFDISKNEDFLKVVSVLYDKSIENTTMNINELQLNFSKNQEKERSSYIEEIRYQDEKTTANIVQSNLEVENNLSVEEIVKTKMVQISEAKESLCVIKSDLNLHKKNDLSECSQIIPELPQFTRIKAIIYERDYDLSRNDDHLEIIGVANDSRYEKSILTINNDQLFLSRQPEESEIIHNVKIKNQREKVCHNIIQNSCKVKNSFTKASVKCIQKAEINNASDFLSITELNIQSNKEVEIFECSSSFTELPQATEITATIIDREFIFSKCDSNIKVDGITKQIPFEKNNLNINGSFVELVRKSNTIDIYHKEKLNSYFKGKSLCIRDISSSLIKKTITSNIEKLLPIPQSHYQTLNLTNSNIKIPKDHHKSYTTSYSFNICPLTVQQNLTAISNTFSFKRNEEFKCIDYTFNDETIETFTKDVSNYDDECICDDEDDIYIYENSSRLKRRRLSSDNGEKSTLNNTLCQKDGISNTVNLETYQNYESFFKMLTNFLNGYSLSKNISISREEIDMLKDVEKNDKVLLDMLILKFKEILPNLTTDISTDHMILSLYKFIKIFDISMNNGQLIFVIPNNLTNFLRNLNENRNELILRLSNPSHELLSFNRIERQFKSISKLIRKLICGSHFQQLIKLNINMKSYFKNNFLSRAIMENPCSISENRKRKHNKIVNIRDSEGENLENPIEELKFKILYDMLSKVDGITINSPTTESFLCKLAEKYIEETAIDYKSLLERLNDSESKMKYKKIDLDCLQNKFFKTDSYSISFSIKKKDFLEYCEKLNNPKNANQMYLDALIKCGTILKLDNRDNDSENDNLFTKKTLSKYLLEAIAGDDNESPDFVNVTLIRNKDKDKKCKIIAEVLCSTEKITTSFPEQIKVKSKRGRKPGSKNIRKKKLSDNLFVGLFQKFHKNIQIEISKKAVEHTKRYTTNEECLSSLKKIFNFDGNMNKIYNIERDDPREILDDIANYNPLLYICATGIRFDELKLFEDEKPLYCQIMVNEDEVCGYTPSNRDSLYHHILQFHYEEAKKCRWKECNTKSCFKAISNYAEHIASHVSYKRFSCLICNNTYSRHADLKVHIRRNHSSYYRLKCPLKRCDHYFTTVEASIKHLHVYHFPIKQWVCPLYGCGKAFFDKGGVNQHIKLCHSYKIKKISKLLSHSEYKNTSLGVITYNLVKHFDALDNQINEELFSHKHLDTYHCKDICVHTKEKPIEISDLTNCIIKKDLQKITDYGFRTFINQLKNYDCYIYIRAVEDMKMRRQYEMLPFLNRALNFFIAIGEGLLHRDEIQVYGDIVIQLNKSNPTLKLITVEKYHLRFEIPEKIPTDISELLKNFILNKQYICPSYLKRVQVAYDKYVEKLKSENRSDFETFKNVLPRFTDYKIPGEFVTCLHVDDGLKIFEEFEIKNGNGKSEMEKYFWKRLLLGCVSILGLSYFKRGLPFIAKRFVGIIKNFVSAGCYKLMIQLKKESGLTKEAEQYYMEQFKRTTAECSEKEEELELYVNFRNVIDNIWKIRNVVTNNTDKVTLNDDNIISEENFLNSFEAFAKSTKICAKEIELPQNKRKIKKNVGKGTKNVINQYRKYDKKKEKDDSILFVNSKMSDIDISCLPNSEDNDVFDQSGVYHNLGYNVQLMCRAKISGIYGLHINDENNSPFEKSALRYMVNPLCCSDIIIPDEYKYETYDKRGSKAYIFKQKRIELVDTNLPNSILSDIMILDDDVAKVTNQTNICLRAHVNPNDRRKIKLKNHDGLIIEIELNQLDYFRCRVVTTEDNELYRKNRTGIKTITKVKPKITALYGVQNWEFIGSKDE
uniref:C2H2-type domain-containing protein n=1 Tax=Strongyloides papillosus TaxID=174720 RepID=A0A0N5C4P9_STREA